MIHEGNGQPIIVKDEHGHTFIESPVTVAAVGLSVAPLLAAVGAIFGVGRKVHDYRRPQRTEVSTGQ